MLQLPMLLTAEQTSRIAAAYETGAADDCVSPEDRLEFGRRAKWFRALGLRAAESGLPRRFFPCRFLRAAGGWPLNSSR